MISYFNGETLNVLLYYAIGLSKLCSSFCNKTPEMVCSEEKENNIKSFTKFGLAKTGALVNATLIYSKDFLSFKSPLYLTSFSEHVSYMLYDFIQVMDESSQKIYFPHEILQLFLAYGCANFKDSSTLLGYIFIPFVINLNVSTYAYLDFVPLT
jgi:hypothetical protein